MEVNNITQYPIQTDKVNQEPSEEDSLQQKGYFLPVLIAVVVLIVIGAGGYLLYQKQAKPATIPQQVTQPTLSPTTSIASDETTNLKSYINTKFNYALKYPNGYILHEEGVLYPPKDLLSYISLELCNIPNASDCGMGSDALNINVYNNIQALTLDNWVEQSENSPKANNNSLCTAKDSRNQITKVKFLGSDAIEFKSIVDEKTVTEVCQDQYPGEFVGESKSIVMARNSKIYVVSYSVSSDEQARGVYGDKIPTITERKSEFEKIISTFKFTQ